MSLSTFAVIGKDNSPLYLKEFPKESEESRTETSQDTTTDSQSDPFGFFEVKNEINKTMSLKNQVRTTRLIYTYFLCRRKYESHSLL